MELIRAWNPQYAPEKTGQIRLCKATFYRDIYTNHPGIRDEKEGKTRLRVEGSITREGEDSLGLPETTVTIAMNDGGIVGTAHLERGSNRATFKQELRTEVLPVPYVFCASRKPESTGEESALKGAFSKEYDAWFIIKDSDALGRDLEKAINGWLFDRQVTQHKLTKRYGWMSYYDGEIPRIVADLSDEDSGNGVVGYIASMEAWFNKRQSYEAEAEYRYAYVIESPQLSALPDCVF